MHDPLSRLAYTAHILSQQQQQTSGQQQQQPSLQKIQNHHSSTPASSPTPNAALSDPEAVDAMTADADGDAADSEYEYEYGYGSGVMDDHSTDNEAAGAAPPAVAGTGSGKRRTTVVASPHHQQQLASCDKGRASGSRDAAPNTPIGGSCSGAGSGALGEAHHHRGGERERVGRRAASPSADAEDRLYGGGGGGGGSSKRPTGRRPVQFWGPFNDWWRSEFERTGKRPGGDLVGEWYAVNAAACWGRDAPSLEETRTHAKCLRSVGSIREYFRSYRARKRARMEDGPSPAAAATGGCGSLSALGPADLSSGGAAGGAAGLHNLAALSCLLPQLSQLNVLGLSPLQVVAAAAAAANTNTNNNNHTNKNGVHGVSPASGAGVALSFPDLDALAAAAAANGSAQGPLTADASGVRGSGSLLTLPYGVPADPTPAALLALLPPLQPDGATRSGGSGHPALPALPAPATGPPAQQPARPASIITTGDGGPSPRSLDAATAAGRAVHRPAVITPSAAVAAAAATSATATSRGPDCEASDRFCRTSSHGGGLDAAAGGEDVAPAQSAKGSGAPSVMPEAKREEAFSFRVASAFGSGCGSGSDGGKSCGSTPPPLPSKPAFGTLLTAANLPQHLLESMPFLDATAVVQVTPRASAPAPAAGLSPQPHHTRTQGPSQHQPHHQQAPQQQQQQPQRRQTPCASPADNGASEIPEAATFRVYGSGPVCGATSVGSPRQPGYAGFRPSSGTSATPGAGLGSTADDEHSLLGQRSGGGGVGGTIQSHDELAAHHHFEQQQQQPREDDALVAVQRAAQGTATPHPEHSTSPVWSSSPTKYLALLPSGGLQQGGGERSQAPGPSPIARAFPTSSAPPPFHPHHHPQHAHPQHPNHPYSFGHHYTHQQPQQHHHHQHHPQAGSGAPPRAPPRSPSPSCQHQPPRYISYHQPPHHHPYPHSQHLQPLQQQSLRSTGTGGQFPPQPGQGPPNPQAPGASSVKAAPGGTTDTQHSAAPPLVPATASPVSQAAAAPATGSSSAAAPSSLLAVAPGGTTGVTGAGSAAAAAVVPSLRSLLTRPDSELCGLLQELPHEQLVLLLLRAVALVRQKKAHEERLMDELAQVLEQQGNLQAQLHAQRMETAKMYRAIMAIRDERSSGGGGADATAVAAAAAAAAGVGFTSSAASPPPPAPSRPLLSSDDAAVGLSHAGAAPLPRVSVAVAEEHGGDRYPGELAVLAGGGSAAAGLATVAAPTATAAAAAAAAAVMRDSARDRATWPATGHRLAAGGGDGAAAAVGGAEGVGVAAAVAAEGESCGGHGGLPEHGEVHLSAFSGHSLVHQEPSRDAGKAAPGAAVAVAATAGMPSALLVTAGHGTKCCGIGGLVSSVAAGPVAVAATGQQQPSGKTAAVACSDGGSGTSSAF